MISCFAKLILFILLDPVDCSWDNWSAWSQCSLTCEVGIKTRSRNISIEASNGGKACSGERQMTVSCNEGACPGKRNLIF